MSADVSRGEVVDALVIEGGIGMLDKGIDLSPEIIGQIVVVELMAVLQDLMPALVPRG
jgi:hypothetical protein